MNHCEYTSDVPVSSLYLTKANIRGRGYVLCWLGLCAHSLYLGQMSLLLSTEFIISSLHISKRWKKTHNLRVIFCSKLKALHLQAWLSSCLFIFYWKSYKTAWTLCCRIVFRALGSDKNNNWLKADKKIYRGLCKWLYKSVFSCLYTVCNIF